MYINKANLSQVEKARMQELKNELMDYLDPDDPELSLIDIEKNTIKLKNLLNELEGIKDA